MIADTTFLIHFVNEGLAGRRGPARNFFAQHRSEIIRTTIISLGVVATGFETSAAAWEYFKLGGFTRSAEGWRRRRATWIVKWLRWACG
jgi:hypothetical protein